MNSLSFVEKFPTRIIARAAIMSSPFVFAGEFIASVVKPLYPYAMCIFPALIVLALIILSWWFAAFVRPKKKAFRRGEIDSAAYHRAVYSCALAQWLLFVVVFAVIFGGFVVAQQTCHQSKAAELWNQAVFFAQENTPVLRDQIEQEKAERRKPISAASRRALVKATNILAVAHTYYDDHKSGVVYKTVSALSNAHAFYGAHKTGAVQNATSATTNAASKLRHSSSKLISNTLYRIKSHRADGGADYEEKEELPATPSIH